MQAIKTRLKLLKNEWWENSEEGLPLFQEMLGSTGTSENLVVVDSLIQERILKTENVISIIKFESKFENRSYSFNCTVKTRFGDVYIDNAF